MRRKMNKKDIPERLFLMMKVALAQLVLRECMKKNKVTNNDENG